MNTAIMGLGSSPITNVDHRFNEHTIALGEPGDLDALAAVYESPLNDGIHESDAGKAIIASYWRKGLYAINEL